MDARGALLALIIQQPRERESLKEVTGKKEDKDAANRGKKFKKRRGGKVGTKEYYSPRLKSRLNNTITVK